MGTTGLGLEQCQSLGNKQAASTAGMWWGKGWNEAEEGYTELKK